MTIPENGLGITPAGTGLGDVAWNILGQTYRPVQHTKDSFAFDTVFPPGTFVPPHVHPDQDEFIRILEGEFELWFDGTTARGRPGDLVRLPMGSKHGIFNKSEGTVRALFWVAPSMRLYELFSQLHDLTDPAEVVKVSATYNVHFLPPPSAS